MTNLSLIFTGALSVILLMLLGFRSLTAIDFSLSKDGIALGFFAFFFGMFVRDLAREYLHKYL